MLNLETPSENDEAKQSSTFKIPANLIPPKARAMSNGKVSPKSSPPREKASPPVAEKSPKTSSPREKASPSKEKSTSLKDKTNQPKASPPKEKVAKKPKEVKSPKENDVETKEEDDALPIIKTVVNGARCPVVTVEQMREVEQICVSETGPNEEMMVENAGHGTSVMALKAIGGHRRIQPGNHNAAPVVVVFAGNTKAGSYGLAAARHLANRACQVYVMLAFRKDGTLSDQVEMQKKCAQFAGAQIVETIEELPQQQTTPVDLIIDGLMGSESSVQLLRGDYATRELLWESMDWANANKAPVLSLDFPSGINATSGLPFHVMHYIQPKWTLCFGAPKQGCTSRQITGELFLADIGIPSVSWRRIGISRCKIPWGAEFVVALEYEG
ncbi:YjeF N-terminal domain-containing protein [Fennellomyces sp. T-0311]|nr:YjeF N-terminal domain-containing protein [Fennellomyces sp. T-0311]